VTEAYVYGQKKLLPAEFVEFFDRGRSAVVSIDMHQGHLADSPDCPCPAPRGREIIEPINAFHRAARAAHVPVIHVRTTLRKGYVDDVKGNKAAWRLTFPLYVGPIPNADEHNIEGTRWTHWATEVQSQDLTVDTKKRLSAFYPTDLDFLLRNLGARVLVLDGAFTDCCVLCTAFEGSNMGYRIIVLRDLVRGTNEEMEEAALKIMSLHVGLVMDSSELLAAWSGSQVARTVAA
jgi:nicotinamidase-related amidase